MHVPCLQPLISTVNLSAGGSDPVFGPHPGVVRCRDSGTAVGTEACFAVSATWLVRCTLWIISWYSNTIKQPRFWKYFAFWIANCNKFIFGRFWLFVFGGLWFLFFLEKVVLWGERRAGRSNITKSSSSCRSTWFLMHMDKRRGAVCVFPSRLYWCLTYYCRSSSRITKKTIVFLRGLIDSF